MGEEAAHPSQYPSLPKGKMAAVFAVLLHVLSLPLACAGVWLVSMRGSSYEALLQVQPQVQVLIGAGLLFLFLFTNATAFHGPGKLLPAALVAALVPLSLFLTVGLMLSGAYKAESRGMTGSPAWLRGRVDDDPTWNGVKGYLFDSGVCSELAFRTMELSSIDFTLKKFSPIEAGCCKPPALCGMEYVNATYWNPAQKKGSFESTNDYENSTTEAGHIPAIVEPASTYRSEDCYAWSNKNDHLCYDCRTCKVGFLVAVQGQWRSLGTFLVVMMALLIVTHTAYFIVCILERREA